MKVSEEVKTKRLVIRAWTDDELRNALRGELSAASLRIYNSMLAGVIAYPMHRLWHTNWEIRLRSDGTLVGEIGFTGHPNDLGEVEMACAILPEYRHKGYAHEAVAAMKDWAFRNEFVYFIMVEESREGVHTHRALHKLGFVPTGRMGEKGPLYEAERPFESATKSMLTIGVTFGLLAGGFVLNDLTAGILIGAVAGYVIAWVLDAKDRRNREKLREKRK